MPRMPDFVPQVRPQNPQTPGLSAPRTVPQQDATGTQMANLGEAMQQAGGAALRISDHIDDVAAITAYNTFDVELTKLEAGYGQMQGKNAMDAYQGTVESANNLRRKFEESLQSERQRSIFASRANIRAGDGQTRLGAHGARQTEIAKIGTLEAGASGSFTNYERTLAFARSIPNEDARADQEAIANGYLQTGLKQKLEASVRRGEPAEMQEAIRVGTLDKVHDSVLDTLVVQDPKAAASYLTQHQADILPQTTVKTQEMIRRANGARREQELQDLAHAVVSAPEMEGLTLAGKAQRLRDQLKAEVLPRDLHDAAMSRLLDQDKQRKAAEASTQDALLTAGRDWVSANQGKNLDQMPPAMLSSLRAAGLWDEIESHKATAGITTELGWQTLQTYRNNTQALVGTDWNVLANSYAGVMSKEDLTWLHGRWESANGISGGVRDKATKVATTEFSSDPDQKLQLMEIAGFAKPGMAFDKAEADKTGLPQVNAIVARDFLRTLQDRVNAEERATGKKLQFDEIKTMVRKWRIEGTVQVGGDTKEYQRALALVNVGDYPNTYILHRGQRVQLTEVLADPKNDYETKGAVSGAAQAVVAQYNKQMSEKGVRFDPLDPNEPEDAMRAVAELKALKQENAQEQEMATALATRDAAAKSRAADMEATRRAQKVIEDILKEDRMVTEALNRKAAQELRESQWDTKVKSAMEGLKFTEQPAPVTPVMDYNTRVREMQKDFDRRGVPDNDPERIATMDRMYANEQQRKANHEKVSLEMAAKARAAAFAKEKSPQSEETRKKFDSALDAQQLAWLEWLKENDPDEYVFRWNLYYAAKNKRNAKK